MPPVYRRTLKDLRTMGSRVDRIANPHMGFMRITSLEMEKARRLSERRSCRTRIEMIDIRIRMIESEKSRLIRGLASSGNLCGFPETPTESHPRGSRMKTPVPR